MSEVVKVHKMKVKCGKKYHCDSSGCSGHVPATLVCSCGYERKFEDPNPHRNQEMKNEHMVQVVKAAGFVFEIVS